jgi:hypothetical protein
MKPMTRGDRRHHEKRVSARKKRLQPGYVFPYPGKVSGKLCSCPMCGNPRRFEKQRLTMQERRANAALSDD